MTKIHKVTLYFIDHEEYSKEDIELILERMVDRVDMGLHIAEHQESKVFEWDDDLSINKRDRATEDFEIYMKESD